MSSNEKEEDCKNEDEQSDDDDKQGTVLATPQDVIDEVCNKGDTVLNEWLKSILKNPPKIDAFLDAENTQKNRFPNVLLYDKTRVRIKDKLGNDYYHASYVDSYDKAAGYVLSQAPFDEATENDFWRMCLYTKPSTIIFLSALVGPNGKRLAKNFWPNVKQTKEFCDGKIRIKCTHMDNDRDHDTYELTMWGPDAKKKDTGIRTNLIQFRKWVDDRTIPDNLLEFRAIVKINIARAEKDEQRAGNVIMFVCPSGVHRSGTMAALDILLDRMASEKKVGLIDTIATLRKQRYGCFTHFEHFSHVTDLLVRHAVSSGIVDTNCIGVRKKNNCG